MGLHMEVAPLSDREFAQFREMIHRIAGISLADTKKPLVGGRLLTRIRTLGLTTFGAYFERLSTDKAELQIAVDLLTTNETYFFREPRHMEFLADQVLPRHRERRPFRVWSAASSSGEEPYSLAMVLADKLGERRWEVLGSDISTRVLEKAARAHYSLERTDGIPPPYLKRFCLKGTGRQEGTLLVKPEVSRYVSFRQVNLVEPLPALGEFDAIFLRNVMIYFDMETKRRVVQRLLSLLRPGGYFFISHSESLNGVNDELKIVMPSVYRKVAA
jgi:chemotaxis protein methyltransferase CheR